MSTTPTLPTPRLKSEDIPDDFFLDSAVGIGSAEDICRAHKLDPADVATVVLQDWFVSRKLQCEQAAMENGEIFKARSRFLALEAQPEMLNLIKDKDATGAARVAAYEALMRGGDLNPKQAAAAAGAGGATIVFNIVPPPGVEVPEHMGPLVVGLGGAPQAVAADATPTSQVIDGESVAVVNGRDDDDPFAFSLPETS